MKTRNLFILTSVVITMMSGCSKFDDSELWSAINQNSQKIAALQEQCNKMNSSIQTLQQLVGALENGDYITKVSDLADGTGYTIIFKSGKSIVIKNGIDGVNGQNGQDGKDGQNGKDGSTPVVSVKQDIDGIYYWIINGEWLLDGSGNKIKAVGRDGVDGVNGTNGSNGIDGKDGITPKFKIENGYWFISYDNEKSWTKLGKATGDNGLNGANGDAFFSGVTMGDGYVIFTLNDGNDTQIKLPFVSDSKLTITVNEPGSLKKITTVEQQRSVITLKIIGSINYDDLRTISCYFGALEELDLSETTIQIEGYDGYVRFNPYGSQGPNRTIRHLIVGQSGIKYNAEETKDVNLSYLFALEKVTFTTNYTHIHQSCLSDTGMSWPKRECKIIGSPNLSSLIIAEGVTDIVTIDGSIYGDGTYSALQSVDLPSTLTRVGYYAFGGFAARTVVCRATTPPSIFSYGTYGSETYYKQFTQFYDPYKILKDMTLYVPKQSVQTYKAADGWKQFGNILPIE